MSGYFKVNSAIAATVVGIMMVVLGSASLLLSLRSMAAVPERIVYLETRVDGLDRRMAALESELKTVTIALATLQAQNIAIMETLRRLEDQQNKNL